MADSGVDVIETLPGPPTLPTLLSKTTKKDTLCPKPSRTREDNLKAPNPDEPSEEPFNLEKELQRYVWLKTRLLLSTIHDDGNIKWNKSDSTEKEVPDQDDWYFGPKEFIVLKDEGGKKTRTDIVVYRDEDLYEKIAAIEGVSAKKLKFIAASDENVKPFLKLSAAPKLLKTERNGGPASVTPLRTSGQQESLVESGSRHLAEVNSSDSSEALNTAVGGPASVAPHCSTSGQGESLVESSSRHSEVRIGTSEPDEIPLDQKLKTNAECVGCPVREVSCEILLPSEEDRRRRLQRRKMYRWERFQWTVLESAESKLAPKVETERRGGVLEGLPPAGVVLTREARRRQIADSLFVDDSKKHVEYADPSEMYDWEICRPQPILTAAILSQGALEAVSSAPAPKLVGEPKVGLPGATSLKPEVSDLATPTDPVPATNQAASKKDKKGKKKKKRRSSSSSDDLETLEKKSEARLGLR